MAAMTKGDLEREIKRIHDAIIRLEPVCEKVEKHEKWIHGNGVPGARTQLYVLWGFFIVLGTVTMKMVSK